ncbi:MAG: type II toxin-antitoxin system Phd/YefM family antitoxin [Actinobacteria bacterium]|nr:type II toxin-antitoxin system Phd/YefM family antitoxin [Actinomycetota bacterium]
MSFVVFLQNYSEVDFTCLDNIKMIDYSQNNDMRKGLHKINIKPSTTIRQDYNGFSKLCHELDEPIVLTRNGEADLVVMSYEAFRRMEARIKLQSKLLVAEKQIAEGAQLLEHDEVIARIRGKLNAAKA